MLDVSHLLHTYGENPIRIPRSDAPSDCEDDGEDKDENEDQNKHKAEYKNEKEEQEEKALHNSDTVRQN